MPTGTVHALLEGIVVAEIQQNSDTTYRVYDWGRVGADGKPRPLHVEKALDVIDFGMVRPRASQPEVIGGRRGVVRYEIARCPYFVVEKVEFERGGAYKGRCDGATFEIWGSVAGSVEVQWSGDPVTLDAVRFALLPAALGEFAVRASGPATVLRAYAPE
jgi:mannose-6-phosphate isomerase